MGKTIKKNQTDKNRVRTAFGGTYVVGGKRFSVPTASSEVIADHMVDQGYRSGARARWNGGQYILNVDYFGEGRLERVND
jgi:hypothetical protein